MRTEVLSPMEIELKMAQCIDALEAAIDAQRELGITYAEANHAYRQAQASEWLRAKTDETLKTDKMREAHVVQATDEKMLARDIAEVRYDAAKSVVRTLQTEAELLRSLARSSRDLVDSWHGGN